MNELRGKGWRVIGYFLWMLGAGVVLDRPLGPLGPALLAIGMALFAAGAWQSLRGGARP
jgi:hypothetical protein